VKNENVSPSSSPSTGTQIHLPKVHLKYPYQGHWVHQGQHHTSKNSICMQVVHLWFKGNVVQWCSYRPRRPCSVVEAEESRAPFATGRKENGSTS